MSGVASQLLRHAPPEDSFEQETHFGRDGRKTEGCGKKTAWLWNVVPPVISCTLPPQLVVLKYVQNKDVFMRYHKTHLTRRLILETSADSEKEENMVEWLRVSQREGEREGERVILSLTYIILVQVLYVYVHARSLQHSG